MACGFGRFKQFEEILAKMLHGRFDEAPALSFIGSGDFHHVTLALLGRIAEPFNLLILDNHPDWMVGVPFLHCGTWVREALRLPNLRTVFHVGGDMDFDNSYRWVTPWNAIETGRIRVVPAVRKFDRGRWRHLGMPVVRRERDHSASRRRIATVVDPFRRELSKYPLYVTLDKDVMTASEATVNWDSGHLNFDEVLGLLEAFVERANGRLAGMDIVGDWSPVRMRGLGRRLLHAVEHPRLDIQPHRAVLRNQILNLELLETVRRWSTQGTQKPEFAPVKEGPLLEIARPN
jgi:arginase family enzyme